jgi:hypothetical protein
MLRTDISGRRGDKGRAELPDPVCLILAGGSHVDAIFALT